MGHWTGVSHVFENGCDSIGDFVDDTPAQREQLYGCPEKSDTCPDDPGKDPIHNYMNYTDDSCRNQFTRLQIRTLNRYTEGYRFDNARATSSAQSCGDGLCTGGETDASCAADCGCAAVSCNLVSPFGCYCDADCQANGDCCSDAAICM